MTSADTTATPHRSRPSTRRLAIATGAAVSAAVAGNIAVRAVVTTVTDVTDEFIPLRLGAVVLVTVVAVAAAAAVLVGVLRWSRRPRRTFTVLVAVGLAVSMLPVIGLGFGGAEPELTSPGDVATLAVVVLHIVPAIAVLALLAPLAPRASRQPVK